MAPDSTADEREAFADDLRDRSDATLNNFTEETYETLRVTTPASSTADDVQDEAESLGFMVPVRGTTSDGVMLILTVDEEMREQLAE